MRNKTALYFVYLALILPSALLRAFVLSKLWEWFVTPFGVMHLTYAHALGLSAVLVTFTYRYEANEDNAISVESVIHTLIFPIVALFYGWVVHQFM